MRQFLVMVALGSLALGSAAASGARAASLALSLETGEAAGCTDEVPAMSPVSFHLLLLDPPMPVVMGFECRIDGIQDLIGNPTFPSTGSDSAFGGLNFSFVFDNPLITSRVTWLASFTVLAYPDTYVSLLPADVSGSPDLPRIVLPGGDRVPVDVHLYDFNFGFLAILPSWGCGGITPVESMTWGSVKSTFR